MLTNTTHVQRPMKNTVQTPYRNSRLCCNFQQLCKLYQQIPVNYTREMKQRFEAAKCFYLHFMKPEDSLAGLVETAG